MAHGARWITLAFVIVGLLNYGYALVLTRLLDVAAYSRFAAGQGLILWASTVATVCVPWVLAQGAGPRPVRSGAAVGHPVRQAGQRRQRGQSPRPWSGSSRCGSPRQPRRWPWPSARSSSSWAPRPRAGSRGTSACARSSVLYVAENVLKNAAGVLLVVVAGLGDTGALAAFGIGGLVMLVWWPRMPRPPPGPGRRLATAGPPGPVAPGPWGRAARIAGAQGMVSLFVAMDVVLVAVLPGNRALAASYQASATLARVPLFVAGAVATAFFPSLSRAGERRRARRPRGAHVRGGGAAGRRDPGHDPRRLLALVLPGPVRRGGHAAEVHRRNRPRGRAASAW